MMRNKKLCKFAKLKNCVNLQNCTVVDYFGRENNINSDFYLITFSLGRSEHRIC